MNNKYQIKISVKAKFKYCDKKQKLCKNAFKNEKKAAKSNTTKVIKEKWGQYFAIDHFCTPLCSKINGDIVTKKFLEQKFAKSSVVNLVPNA